MKYLPDYDVSVTECGRLFRGDKELKPHTGKNRYITIVLRINGERKCMGLHVLVALAHVPNPNNYPIVLHLDNDPSNCHKDNLKWGTQSMNIRQAFDEGRKISGFTLSRHMSDEDVIEMRRRYKPRCSTNGAKVLAAEFGYDHSVVKAMLEGRTYKDLL
ncbi:HNH endonuclease [Vibrio phage K479]